MQPNDQSNNTDQSQQRDTQFDGVHLEAFTNLLSTNAARMRHV
jgi:hypothetical protein